VYLKAPAPREEDEGQLASREDQSQELDEAIVNTMRRDPTEAVRGLRRLGWTVLPPRQREGGCAASPKRTSEAMSATTEVPAGQ
jgi:hypothetical protein